MSSTPGLNADSAIIPLAVLCFGLVAGGIAAVIITRKISRARVIMQIRQAQELAEGVGEKPLLVEVRIGPPPEDRSRGPVSYPLPWSDFLPMSVNLSSTLSSPHPHHTIEHRPGYQLHPLVDGNVMELTVGIAMPTSSLNTHSPRYTKEPPLDTLEYCIGTKDAVVCTVLGTKQRLLGLN